MAFDLPIGAADLRGPEGRQLEATELQELLNGLSPGDMVRLTRAQFTTAFGAHGSIEEQRRAAVSRLSLWV